MQKTTIRQLDLIGSSSCDLKCSYCYITKNCSFFEKDEEIKKAWETGEYLDTVEKVFKKLDQDPSDVEDLQLWGGEPTVHMAILAKQAKRLGSLFPNITHFLIPTNWNNLNIKALVEFIYNLGKGLNKREQSENYLNFHIQASIDGPPGDLNTYGHNVSWDKYKENFDNLCKYIQEKNDWENINIILTVCGTSTQHLILKNFNDFKKIKEFKNFINKVVAYVDQETSKIKNVNIFLASRLMTPRIAISQQTTTEEAVELEKIIRLLEYCNHIDNINYFEDSNEIQLFRATTGESTCFNRNHECPESNESCITLMPDGTIAECPCTFLENLPEYQKELLNQKDYWEYKSCLIRLPSFYNPLFQNIKEDEYHSWYVYGGGFLGTDSTYANLNLSMAYEMALSRQIDFNYARNPDLLIQHFLADFMSTECYRENVNVTHNYFLADHNMFRRWYNGYVEYAYNDHKERMKLRFNKRLKGEENEFKLFNAR